MRGMAGMAVVLGLMAASGAWAVNVTAEAHGAKGDGQADDGPAIQRAMDAVAAAGGGRVTLDGKRYRLHTALSVPSGVSLAGTWDGPHFPPQGTMLMATANRGQKDGPPLIRLNANATVKGVTIFYPDQKLDSVAEYPWAIQGSGTNGNVIDVTLVNPVRGIDFGTHANELHYIRNVFGCPLQAGVYLDRTTDIGRVENVHFNPNFWNRSGLPNAPPADALIAYLGKNLVAFDIGRSDWEFITNTFSFGAKIGYRFFKSPAGPCNGNFQGIAADWATTGVLIEETQAPGLLITNGEFVGNPGCEAIVEVRATHTGAANFNNCAFWGPQQRIARIAGSGHVSFNNGNFVQWDPSGKGLPAIEVLGGGVDVSHCYFRDDKTQVTLAEDVTAVIMGNRFTGAARVVNRGKADVQILGNVSRKQG